MGGALGLERHVTFWLAILLFAVAAIWLLSDILLPFVAGAVLAYLFNPLAQRLSRLGLPRMAASLLIIGAFVVAFILLLLVLVPLLAGQLGELAQNFPSYVRRIQGLLMEVNLPWLRRLLGQQWSADAPLGDVVGQGAGWLAAFVKSLWSGGRALISVLSLVVVTPVVAFYLLYDWDHMIATVDGWVPLHQRETVRELARQIDVAIAGFIRGQTAVCLILGTFYAVGLTLVGLNFGFLIGLAAGLLSFIPYIGSMSGLLAAAGVAVAQFWPAWTPILLVLAVFFAGQFFEGNILSPKLVGESVGLHPVWLMFALFAFGYLFGFVGLLLAVPMAAAIGVLARFAIRRYRASALYTGMPPGSPAPPPAADGQRPVP